MAYEDSFKDFLKGHNVQDESVSKMEMMDLQKAINNSKETVNTDKKWAPQTDDGELEKKSKEKPSTVKQSKQNPVPKVNSSEKKKEFLYTFHDMPACSKESLEIVYHKPKYDLPIPTNPKYKNLSVQEKARLLDNYYTKINNIKRKLAEQSLHRAPLSEPILASAKCKTSLLKINEEDFFEDSPDQIPTHEFYVSRAGRQIKRKIYSEDAENDNDSDSDFATSIKKNKTAINSDTKITIDTPCVVEEKRNENNTKSTTKPKKDAPKRPSKAKKLSRAEEMFKNLILDGKNAAKKELERANFEESLSNVDDDDEKMSTDGSPIKTSKTGNYENSVKSKAESTEPHVTTTKSAQEDSDFDSQDIVPTTPPDSPILKYRSINRSVEMKPNQLSKDNSLSEKKSEEVKRDCPLCGKEFPQSEIEDHAANCGNFENEVEKRHDTPRPPRTKFYESQSQDIFENTSQDEHVKQRMRQTNLNVVYEEDSMVIDDNSPVKDDSEEKNEASFVKRKVVPPKPNIKKFPKSRKPASQEDLDKIEILTPSSSSVNKNNPKRGQKAGQSKENLQEKNAEVNKTDCPICGKLYPLNEIEDHAANCENFKIDESTKSKSRSERMMCAICDKAFLRNTEYEVHVKQCIAGKIIDM